MTENEARYLARRNPHFRALNVRGEWIVWDKQFEDEVVFERADYVEAQKTVAKEYKAKLNQLERGGTWGK